MIIYSGGMDSTTLLYQYRNDIELAVSFNYGSKHNKRELDCAKWHCKKLAINHIIISLPLDRIFRNSSLLNQNIDIPEGHYQEKTMKSTVVPFRNGIMLSVAIGLAEDKGINHIYIANHSGDHAIYPDCRPEFIKYMNQASMTGTYNQVKILAPYTNKTKREIALIGRDLGVDYENTWSCYKGLIYHCGKCGTCIERKEALEGFDPTRYYKEDDWKLLR